MQKARERQNHDENARGSEIGVVFQVNRDRTDAGFRSKGWSRRAFEAVPGEDVVAGSQSFRDLADT